MDGKWVLQQVQRRLNGLMGDREWAEFQNLLDRAGENAADFKCATCCDTGTVTRTASNGGRYLYLCHCEASKLQGPMYAASDKEKAKPITLATYREPRPYVKPFGEKDD